MNIKVIVCLMTIMFCMPVAACQKVFAHANTLYDQKAYAQALELYNSLPNKGFAVWYNMGNAAYKLHELAAARVYWKQAQRLVATREQQDIVSHNISLLDGLLDAHDEP